MLLMKDIKLDVRTVRNERFKSIRDYNKNPQNAKSNAKYPTERSPPASRNNEE